MKENYEDNGYCMDVLHAGSLRDLVRQVNDKGIIKDDIVQVFREDDVYFLLYYK